MHNVDIALAALADPTRRRIVELLVEAPRRTNELADAVGASVPAVSRHLRVLRERDLVDRVDVDGDGRGRRYQLIPGRLTALQTWLSGTHWTDELSDASRDPDITEYLARVGGFLDGFATSDLDFFARHLAADVELIFPGHSRRWDRESTLETVAQHPPYVEWTISDSSVRTLSPGLALVTITVAVRTTEGSDAIPVVQSMVFDDTGDPWTLRFLQQSTAS